jgi:N-acetylglucosamine kinase-like BadF-type ATPase
MTRSFLGVDIGAAGAIAILTDSGELIEVHDGGPATLASSEASS